jgi:hypothetical protein
MKPLSLITIVFILSSCHEATKTNVTNKNLPDSSVSNFLKLRDPDSTPDSIKSAIKDNVVVIANNTETSFLIAYQYPGDPPGSFIGFELSNLSNKIVDCPYVKTNIAEFTTGSGVSKLNEVQDILQIKGKKYIKTEENGVVIYSYLEAPKDFLERHNSDGYMFEVEAVDGLLSRIHFGLVQTKAPENMGKLKKVEKDL